MMKIKLMMCNFLLTKKMMKKVMKIKKKMNKQEVRSKKSKRTSSMIVTKRNRRKMTESKIKANRKNSPKKRWQLLKNHNFRVKGIKVVITKGETGNDILPLSYITFKIIQSRWNPPNQSYFQHFKTQLLRVVNSLPISDLEPFQEAPPEIPDLTPATLPPLKMTAKAPPLHKNNRCTFKLTQLFSKYVSNRKLERQWDTPLIKKLEMTNFYSNISTISEREWGV